MNTQQIKAIVMQPNLMTITLAVALALMLVFVLMAGQSVLIPVAIAVLLWFVINALSNALRNTIRPGSHVMPGWAGLLAALLIVIAVVIGLAEVVASSGLAMLDRLPQYTENLSALSEKLSLLLGFEIMSQIASAIDGLDFEAVILAFTDGAASLLGNIGTVILYVAFLLVEQQFMPMKLDAIAGTEKRGAEIRRVMDDISRRIRTYLFTKSLTSAAMAGVVWIFLLIVGVDFAGFWALLVFILNFIPVVGGIVSGVFPALLALVQFPTFGPFMIVVAGVATAHLIIGNVVEPRFVGSSVNLSPLVVILALAIWGLIWGIPGMFLCIPLTVIAMIIFAEFDSTRPIAIALSENGELGQVK
ncbi:MAG: AI-2E family transporter [Pseudomonadota bacterium]